MHGADLLLPLFFVVWSACSYFIGRHDGHREGFRKGWNECKQSNSYSGYGDYLSKRMERN
jgi:hypothetical protein